MGTPLPNPHIWETGWALTFTDGRRRLTLVVGDTQEFEGAWSRVSVPGFESRRLEIQRRQTVLLVRLWFNDVQVVIVGEGVSEGEMLRVAANTHVVPRLE